MKNKRKYTLKKEPELTRGANKTKILVLSILGIIIAGILISSLSSGKTNADLENKNLQTLRINVKIPCPGHALLISQNLKKVPGVYDVNFNLPNIFEIKYNPQKTSKQEILNLDIFSTYSAKTLS